MRPGLTQSSGGFGTRLTGLGKKLLLIYGIIYVAELLLEHWLRVPVVQHLQLYPLTHPSFQVWQIVTHPFIHDPASPLGFMITCVVFYFFSAPVEAAFGPRRFLILFYSCAAGAAVCGLSLGSVTGLDGPFLGMMPSLLALIVVFGLLNPEATILLMFILPVKAKYLSYGTLLITFMTFLAKANPHGAYHLGGIFCGWLYMNGLLEPKLLYLKFLKWQLARKRSRLKVINGFKDRDQQPPTYH